MIATAKDPATTLRIPEPLLVTVRRAAANNGRSLNTEILLCLSRRFKPSKKK